MDLSVQLSHEHWRKFENLVASICEANGFEVKLHYRIKTEKGLSEVDVLAIKPNFAVAIECKKLGKGYHHSSIIKKAKEKLKEKIDALEEQLGREVFGIIVTLWPAAEKYIDNIMVVFIDGLNEVLKNIEAIVFK